MPTISFDVTADQANRISTAIGKTLNLGRDATLAEVKAYLIERLREIVRNREMDIEQAKIIIPTLEVT